MGNFRIENRNGKQVLVIEIEAPHQQVTPYWENYDITKPLTGDTVRYSDAANITGHQQRSLLQWIVLKAFTESGGYPVLDCGGGGVMHPGAISLDLVGTGEEPAYKGIYEGVNIKADASKLENFGSNSFSGIVSLHLAEHLPCHHYSDPTTIPWQGKMKINCLGTELIDTIRNVWLRIIRPTGYILMIIPDDDKFRPHSSVLAIDKTHTHAYGSSTFRNIILDPLLDVCKIVQYNTLDNEFSFDALIQKL